MENIRKYDDFLRKNMKPLRQKIIKNKIRQKIIYHLSIKKSTLLLD